MPELPEVETVVRGLRESLIGHQVRAVWGDYPAGVVPSLEEAVARLNGQTFRAIKRRAKFIVCELDHDFMVVHLRMTGRLYVTSDEAVHDADRWVHFRLQLDAGQQLRFSDARKFGRIYITHDLEPLIGKLGPEPLAEDFTLGVFRERLRQRRQKVIKALLLDQAFIAGVGNIYADEALFLAGIHPLRHALELSEAEVARLYDAIRAALSAGIQYEGASISWYRKPDGTAGESQEHFYVYGRNGQPCLKCGHLIEKIRVAQRGTHYCPHCQPSK